MIIDVKGIGPERADIMIIGEAPGADEITQGVPFVGLAGKLLTQLLHAEGISRQDCYITNVIKVRPPGNKITPYINFRQKGNPITDLGVPYVRYLREEIERINPNVILAVGAVPLYVLCELKGITKYRGSILLAKELNKPYKVIPCIHTSAALRQHIWRYLIQFDIAKMKKESTSQAYTPIRRKYKINPSYTESRHYLHELKKAKRVGFDIEVLNGEVSCISFADSATSAISIPFVKDSTKTILHPTEEYAIWKDIGEILQDKGIEKVAHQAAFDSSFLFSKYGIRTEGTIHDTMVACGIIFPEFKKGLDFVTSIYTDIPYYKDDGKYRIKTGKGSDDGFWLYNAKDSIVVMDALPDMLEDLKHYGNMDTYYRQVGIIPSLVYMSDVGIKADGAGLDLLSAKADTTLLKMQKEILTLMNDPTINLRSPAQLCNYFYTVKKIKPYTKDGKPTVDEKALKRLKIKGLKEAEKLLDYRKLDKLNGTYYKIKLLDGRVNCSYNPVGTKFGRISSSKTIFGTGGNMQNQPIAMKKMFLVDDESVVYNIDLSQAENRIVAVVGPDLRMLEAFETGADIHSTTASYIYGIPIEDVSTVKGSSGIGDRSQRDIGKMANHALNYGLGVDKFSLQAEITTADARMIHSKYHQVYPGVAQYHRRVEQMLKDNNRIMTNLFGRSMHFMDRWGQSMFQEAYAFIPQSTVADKINEHGLIYIWGRSDFFKSVQILNQVHDSIVIQIPYHKMFPFSAHERMLKRIVESLETPLEYRGKQFTIPVDVIMHRHNLLDGEELPRHNINHQTLSIAYNKQEKHGSN